MPNSASGKRAASSSAVKKATKKKAVKTSKIKTSDTPAAPKPPILDSLHILPKGRDAYLWCDFIELRCLVHPDKQFSRQDLIEVIDDSRAAGIDTSPLDDSAGDDESGEYDVAETTGDEEANDFDHDDDDAVIPSTDKSESDAADRFANLELRAEVFGEAYPFQLHDAGHLLKVKDPPLSPAQHLYLQLLLSSSLRFVPAKRRKELTDPFESLSHEIFRGLMPSGWEVHQFGASNSTRYTGHLSARMDLLAEDWRGKHLLDPKNYAKTNSGDGGLDLVAWHPMGNDRRVGIPLAAAQCGCSATEWQLKSLEASPAVLSTKMWVHHPWATYYFMPQDLLAIINDEYDWQRRNSLTQSIVVDRLRIVRLANQFGVSNNFESPSPAVSEATTLGLT